MLDSKRLTLACFIAFAAPLAACGGSTTQTGTGGAGTGASAGSSGAGASGGTGAGGSGAVAGTGGSATGGAPGGGGVAGAGGWPSCCASNADCPGGECVNTMCEPVPDAGTCWSDADCGGTPGSCQGGMVCGCAADCSYSQVLGKCGVSPNCCKLDADCGQSMGIECVDGNCVAKPPPMQCWGDKDCPGTACVGACSCPCGTMCDCGGTTGWCDGPAPPPSSMCCNSNTECGPFAECAKGVCKVPSAAECWTDADCASWQKCVGPSICPCGAMCFAADHGGTCQ